MSERVSERANQRESADVDVVVVGAGHNGLTCAAYLARAGLEVLVLERATEPGGALWSTAWNGYRLERGAVEHTAILTSGVLDELDLATHGLRYETRTAAAVHLFGDGMRIDIASAVEDTAASIAAVSQPDAEAWVRLAAQATPLLQAFALASQPWIPPPAVATSFARVVGGRRAADLIELTRLPIAVLAERWFESPHVRALAVFRSAFAGLGPWTTGSASAFLLTVAGHGRRFGRPVGGSCALVGALVAAVESAGGAVRCNAGVDAVRRSGRGGWHLDTARGTVQARRAVVSAMAPRSFLVDVLAADELSGRARRRVEATREVVDNVSQLTLAAAIDDASSLPRLGGRELDGGTMWLLPNPADALDVYAAAERGALPSSLPTLLTFPSVADPSAAPAGAATMWANAFTARRLADRTWADAAEDATGLVWDAVRRCLPGDVSARSVREVLTTPDDLTAHNGADNAGNHVAPLPEQTLGRRPALGFGNHRTPIDGIYVTGAGTHPGGGVSGSSGRACAQAVLDDCGLGRSRRRRATRRGRAGGCLRRTRRPPGPEREVNVDVLARRPLGRTGLEVGRLSFGSAPMASAFWGNREDVAIAAAQRAVEVGIALFDTAPLYGAGEAEARLGMALADAPDVLVATKVGRTLVDGDAVFDFSAAAVRRQLESSLQRLGRDRADLVHVHDPDDHLAEALDGCLPALAALADEGLVGAVSVGTTRCATALHLLRHADLDAVMLAGRLTLLDRSALDEVVPVCRRAGVPLLAAGVFNSGVLARPSPGAWFDYAPADDPTLRRAQELATRCTEAGVELRAAAMAFPLRFAEVASVVVGMATPDEVDDDLALLSAGVPDELWAALDELEPGR